MKHSKGRISPGDLIAGLSVALVAIPQALAYADLAGMPPGLGLVAAALPPIAAAFLASSRYLQTGPVALTGLLTFSALASLGLEPKSEDWIRAASLLALMVGVIRLALGLLGAGAIAYLLSQPVLTGFTAAASIIIIASQLPTAVGAETTSDGLFGRAFESFTVPWHSQAVMVAVITAVIILGVRRIHRLIPGVLLAGVIAIILGAAGIGGQPIGEVTASLPTLNLGFDWASLPILLVPAAVVALVGFAEPASIARTYAAMDRTSWSADREFLAQGAANITAGFTGAFPVGGSFSRTGVARMAGATSRWAGGIAGLIVLGFLPFARILEDLPKAFLAAVVIIGVAPLVRPDRILTVGRSSRPQGLVALITFVGTLALNPRIDLGITVGIAAAVLIHLWRELHLQVGRDFEGETVILRPKGVLFFASTPEMEDRLVKLIAQHPEASRVVIDLSGLGRIDYTGAVALRALCEDTTAAGLEVSLRGVPPQSTRLVNAVLGEFAPESQ
ncbi:MAG: SulP family inorganic anion transporter [Acidimicrobiia bacterium]|nr:SulP family inorganic anion transporter [Acidimicrobiia bacterium]MDH4307735.1 SulP family inorganic anion transporter [Acidimicrobiia bacterium]